MSLSNYGFRLNPKRSPNNHHLKYSKTNQETKLNKSFFINIEDISKKLTTILGCLFHMSCSTKTAFATKR